MGAFEINMPDDFLSQYNFTESELKEIVADAAPMLQTEMQKCIRNVISNPSDSDLVQSVKVSNPKVAKTDAVISFVGPAGKDRNGVRNIEKAIFLCYGTKHQSARPWLAKSINNAQGKVEKAIQDSVERKFK